MNLPNILTLARIVLVPVFLFALLTRLPSGGLLAAAVFVVAAITDGVDGYLARKNKEVTRLGKFLDPLADKLLVSTALVAMVELRLVNTWVAMVIIGREMAVTGLRAIAAAEGTVVAAGPWGKAKTVVQIVFILSAILERFLPQGFWLERLTRMLVMPLLVVAVALTLWSGIDYFLAYMRGQHQEPNEPSDKPLRFKWKLSRRRRRSDS